MNLLTWSLGTSAFTTQFHHDPAGCLDSVTYPTGSVVTATCDSKNRVLTLSRNGQVIVKDVQYHPSGQVKKMTYGDLVSTVTTLGHDSRGRVTSSSSGVLGMNLTLGYDGEDNLTSYRNGVTNWENSLNYDSLGRLSWATSWYGTYAYDYDTLGNRILKSGAQTTSAAYDSSNRLSTACGPERFKTMTFTWN